ncbi:hypothetical protein BaRGS_00006837 [Batillaria attramentaria]|uniref:Uncharacterized protein n=1 Tax=Batillaria attramentaria TaxID=370345 RepID=A0ABD0LR92_9CAEN
MCYLDTMRREEVGQTRVPNRRYTNLNINKQRGGLAGRTRRHLDYPGLPKTLIAPGRNPRNINLVPSRIYQERQMTVNIYTETDNDQRFPEPIYDCCPNHQKNALTPSGTTHPNLPIYVNGWWGENVNTHASPRDGYQTHQLDDLTKHAPKTEPAIQQVRENMKH